MKDSEITRIVEFLFEVGTLRKIARSHRQALLTDDLSDNIASHSFRVAVIAWFLATVEKADPYKAVVIGLFHDVDETRSGDQNWIHKKYTKVYDGEMLEDQFGVGDMMEELYKLRKEYMKKEAVEAILAKDADYLDQALLLREYELQGNQEAKRWLVMHKDLDLLKSDAAKKLAKEIYEQSPSQWWNNHWQSKRR